MARLMRPKPPPLVFAIGILAGVLAAAGCVPRESTPPARRPNILFALSDDQSWLHTSFAGYSSVSTPAFDRIAREGVYFTNSFSACPSCTPARSAILSGQDIWRLREAGLLYGSIPRDLPLFSLVLDDAGYHVGYTGKGWVPGDPYAQGLERDPIGKEYNDRRHASPPPGIDARDYAANFEDFLADRPSDTPFFFWYGSTEPHRVYEDGAGLRAGKKISGLEAPDFLPDVDLVRGDLLDYCVEVDWFDRQLDRMLKKLEDIGELDNTIVVVTSDNGMPFPRAKTTLYDWGVRMPLAIRWGERVPGGRVIEDFVCHTDFAPTFLEAAGLRSPARMNGRSLLSLLLSGREGRIDPDRDHVVTATERHTWCRPDGATYPVRAIRTREFLYIRNFAPDRWPTGGPTFVSSNKTYHGDVDGCPTKTYLVKNRESHPREYQLCFGKRPREELYSVADDPGQTNNLADDSSHTQIKERLWRRLKTRLERGGDPRVRGEDPWQEYTYHQTIGFGASFNRSLSEEERRRAVGRDAHKPE